MCRAMKKYGVRGILVVAAIAFCVLSGADAPARITKQAKIIDKGLALYGWPVLPKIAGWSQDMGASSHYNCNALAPDGFTFGNAETVLYANAVYKPQVPDVTSLEMFIEADGKRFAESTEKPFITEVAPLTTADGMKLRSVTFFPREKGNWERVSYAEEGDFYLTFTLSSRTREGYEKALSEYFRLVQGYSEGLEESAPTPAQ